MDINKEIQPLLMEYFKEQRHKEERMFLLNYASATPKEQKRMVRIYNWLNRKKQQRAQALFEEAESLKF